ncbi:hypothetical protein FA13DRAFT_1745280 [Coprinellus micaceus]|uniref:[histone H3]-trimethyl-L-lysine(9) demethylase n=1 Tax=Coprinellus micaceus TaxID=71717 RepID=A0A4Y7SBJ8_COPMI|nr:hypothetical protein FA13DRAFT_1745280 [Coprinellus micaceus]
MAESSSVSSLTPCRSPTPEPPIMQPDHFYGSEGIQFPPSPKSEGKTWLDPKDDLNASRGIPVFKPTMEQFQDFEGYMEKINCWGQRSGIVKVIPPKEWKDSLPSIRSELKEVKIKSPIEQIMLGNAGLYRQQNMEKRKTMSVREWAELCGKEEYRAPAVHEVTVEGRRIHTAVPQHRVPRPRKKKEEQSTKEESAVPSPPGSDRAASPPAQPVPGPSKPKGRRAQQPKEVRDAIRDAKLAENAAKDDQFLEGFDWDNDWLPHNTLASDYTPEWCQTLERHYWKNCSLGKSPWYGADTQGTLFTDETEVWNVGHLPSALDRLLPSSNKGLPGVNMPYLYFGMWRATFAWHVEDMDLYSINYIHFGAPKFWYAVPQNKAQALEHAMRTYFPKDTSQCHQFLRHKSFLASPTILANSSCRPNHLVQHAGEFVITYPRGYHAGFNLGFNCAESVNFALECWIEMGRNAKICECVSDSVRIDVDQLLRDRAEEKALAAEADLSDTHPKPKRAYKKKPADEGEPMRREADDQTIPLIRISSKKRKVEGEEAKVEEPKLKRIKLKVSPQRLPPVGVALTPSSFAPSVPPSTKPPPPRFTVTLKVGPRPPSTETEYPCCLCVSETREGLLPVHEPPVDRKDAVDAANNPKVWSAHELCASVIPETWVDDFDRGDGTKTRMVFGVGAIVKDRWNLKCSACVRSRPKRHGAPVQCTKGKCPKAFHVGCAQNTQAHSTTFTVVREVEKEVVILESTHPTTVDPSAMQVEGPSQPPRHVVPASQERVLKVIRKLEVQILCAQHNPTVAALKKASKQEKIKQDLLALPPLSRIKIRVSSGVFEVSLIRVIEETSSVRVVWDQGVEKEFNKRPSNSNPMQPYAIGPNGSGVDASTVPVPIYPSVTAATAELSSSLPQHSTDANNNLPPHPPAISSSTTSNAPAIAPASAPAPVPGTSAHGYSYTQRASPYDYWPYATPQQVSYGAAGHGYQPQVYAAAAYPYSSGYYSGATAYPTGSAYNVYSSYGQTGYHAGTSATSDASAEAQYRNGTLQWQRPYQGPGAKPPQDQRPPQAQLMAQLPPPSSVVPAGEASRPIPPSFPQSSGSNVPADRAAPASSSAPIEPSDFSSDNTAPSKTAPPSEPGRQPSTPNPAGSTPAHEPNPQQVDLGALARLPKDELMEILSQNPQLSQVILTALSASSASPLNASQAYPLV